MDEVDHPNEVKVNFQAVIIVQDVQNYLKNYFSYVFTTCERDWRHN